MSSPISPLNLTESSSVATARSPNARPTTALVPAAGWGTRLRPLTDAIPKEMLPVGRRLALEHIVAELGASGIDHAVFILSEAKEPLIRRYFGEGRDGMTFSYALQPEMRGLGDAVLCAQPFCADDAPLLIALGDAVYEEATPGAITRRLVDAYAAADDAPVGVVVQRLPRERISKYGVVKPVNGVGAGAGVEATSFAISDIVEKPAPEDAPSEYAVAARFVVRPTLFRELRQTKPGIGGEIQLTDALRAALRAGSPAGVAVPLQAGEARHDIGSLDTYFRAFAAFALKDAECGESLRAYVTQWLAETEKDASS